MQDFFHEQYHYDHGQDSITHLRRLTWGWDSPIFGLWLPHKSTKNCWSSIFYPNLSELICQCGCLKVLDLAISKRKSPVRNRIFFTGIMIFLYKKMHFFGLEPGFYSCCLGILLDSDQLLVVDEISIVLRRNQGATHHRTSCSKVRGAVLPGGGGCLFASFLDA